MIFCSPVNIDPGTRPRTNCKIFFLGWNVFGYMDYLTYKKTSMLGGWVSGSVNLVHITYDTKKKKFFRRLDREYIYVGCRCVLMGYHSNQESYIQNFNTITIMYVFHFIIKKTM